MNNSDYVFFGQKVWQFMFHNLTDLDSFLGHLNLELRPEYHYGFVRGEGYYLSLSPIYHRKTDFEEAVREYCIGN